ncbi:MAG: STN domain-containing protein, partial [Gluconacetobacter liquefaciens]
MSRSPSPHLSPQTLAALLVMSTAIAGFQPARAGTGTPAPVTVHLRAQPLAESLEELARISGRDILFASSDIGNRSAPAVDGTLSVEDAASRLLRGSGLHAVPQHD